MHKSETSPTRFRICTLWAEFTPNLLISKGGRRFAAFVEEDEDRVRIRVLGPYTQLQGILAEEMQRLCAEALTAYLEHYGEEGPDGFRICLSVFPLPDVVFAQAEDGSFAPLHLSGTWTPHELELMLHGFLCRYSELEGDHICSDLDEPEEGTEPFGHQDPSRN